MSRLQLQSESTLTDRYQTTVPDTVRKALHLDKRDKIRYIIQSDGHVLMSRVDTMEEDPAIAEFLNFLATDVLQSPQNVHTIQETLFNRAQRLVSGVQIDLDALLPDEENSQDIGKDRAER